MYARRRKNLIHEQSNELREVFYIGTKRYNCAIRSFLEITHSRLDSLPPHLYLFIANELHWYFVKTAIHYGVLPLGEKNLTIEVKNHPSRKGFRMFEREPFNISERLTVFYFAPILFDQPCFWPNFVSRFFFTFDMTFITLNECSTYFFLAIL